MISLVSFTKEKTQAMRNKMVQAAIARKLPESTGGRTVLFNWGLPTCDRNRTLQQNEAIWFCATTLKGMELLKNV